MKTYVLSVPSKKTDEVNWASPLNGYLASIYGAANEFSSDVNGFNKLRQDLKGVNADSTGIKLYYKYYSQLELLDLRIPFSSINGHRKISFVWHDAFTKGVSHKQHSLPFEKANVLFNLASILSKVASQKYEESQRSSSKDSTDDTVKEVLLLFQQAAGIFQFVSENFLHAPSEDLSQGTLQFLVKLCLAQSQEIFVLKAIAGDLEQKKNSLIARLCASTANFYTECANMIDNSEDAHNGLSTIDFDVVDTNENEDGLEDITDPHADEPNPVKDTKLTIKLESLWSAIISFKKLYYKSLAYYFHGLNLEATSKFGDAIAYISKSSDLLEEIHTSVLKTISKSGVHEVYEILDNYKFHKDALGIKINELNKDNDLIYHDIVPSKVTIPEVKPLEGVKQIPINNNALFNEINQHNYENFLKNVIPIDIHELLSYYSEEKSQFLRNELDLVDVSDEELASVLEYLKMPKALVTLKQIINEDESSESQDSTGISSDIIRKVDEISNHYSSDSDNKEKILSYRKQIYGFIGEVESKMSTNPTLTKFKDEIIYLKKSLYDTSSFDEKVFQYINNENNQLYNILKNGSNSPQFKQLFETQSGMKASQPVVNLLDLDLSAVPTQGSLTKQISVLEEILFDLNTIKGNKLKLVDTLKNEIHNDDISDILILNSKVKTTNEIKNVIFPEELKKFEPYAQELDTLITKQKLFIETLKEEWAKLSSNSKVKEIQSSKSFKENLKRDQEARIEDFYNKNWKLYSQGLARGVTVYSQLLSFVNEVRAKVQSEITNAANTERFANFSLGGSSTPSGYESQRGLVLSSSGGQPYGKPQQYSQSLHYSQQQYGQTTPGSYSQAQHTGPQIQHSGPQTQYGQQSTSSGQGPQYGQSGQQYSQSGQQYSQSGQQYSQSGPQYSQYGQPPQHYAPAGQQYSQPQHSGPPLPQRVPSFGPGQPNFAQTGLTSSSFSYERPPPSLPPKTGGYSGPQAAFPGQELQTSVPMHVPGSYDFSRNYGAPTPETSRTEGRAPAKNNPGSLIYDQPLTYNPDMYNFFSKN